MPDLKETRASRIERAAAALLRRVDTLTTPEFERGAERPEREELRAALGQCSLADEHGQMEHGIACAACGRIMQRRAVGYRLLPARPPADPDETASRAMEREWNEERETSDSP